MAFCWLNLIILLGSVATSLLREPPSIWVPQPHVLHPIEVQHIAPPMSSHNFWLTDLSLVFLGARDRGYGRAWGCAWHVAAGTQ